MLQSDLSALRKRQMERELTCIERARLIASDRLDKNMDKGRVDCLPYKSAVMNKMVTITDEVIQKIFDTRNSNETINNSRKQVYIKYADVLKDITDVVDVSVVISDFLLSILVNEPKTFSTIGRQLGARIYKTYHMMCYIKENKYYYEEMTRYLNDNRIGSFDKVYERFLAGARVDNSLIGNPEFYDQLATAILNKVLKHPDTYLHSIVVPHKRKTTHKYLYMSTELMELMSDMVQHSINNTFDRMPMVCEPRDWKKEGTLYVGGYLTPTARQGTKIFSGEKHKSLPELIPDSYLNALNKLQKTPYAINTYIYNITRKIFENDLEIAKIPRSTNVPLTDIPCGDLSEEVTKQLKAERRGQHVENMKSFSKSLSLLTALKQCEELKNDKIYFVYSLCYRGRLYCMSNGLNVQSSDMIKALLQLDEAKEVGERGLYWLKIRAANTLGQDKLEPDDRVAYIDSLIKAGTIAKIAANPIDNRDLWQNADKPMQYLATVHELAIAYKLKDPTKHMSRLPVGLDGSCNGSQHLSVLAKDPILAKSVNVLPSNRCMDVYQDVVDYVYKHMYDRDLITYITGKKATMEHYKYTVKWLLEKFPEPPRKLVKRCVMTLPYGATLHGFMDFVREFLQPYKDPLKNKMVVILMFMIEQALNKTTGGAVKAMKFIQTSARKRIKETGTFKFTTPLGLEVNCFKATIKTRRLKVIGYECILTEFTDKPNVRAIEACSAPNYVHSLDACHLIKVINNDSLGSLQAIHDDIGTHPSDTDALYKIIREEFVDLYEGKDYFTAINDTPFKYGEGFDVREVLKSTHFFL